MLLKIIEFSIFLLMIPSFLGYLILYFILIAEINKNSDDNQVNPFIGFPGKGILVFIMHSQVVPESKKIRKYFLIFLILVIISIIIFIVFYFNFEKL